MFTTEHVFARGSWTAFQVFLCNPTVDYEHPVPGFIGEKNPGWACSSTDQAESGKCKEHVVCPAAEMYILHLHRFVLAFRQDNSQYW